MIEKGTLVAVNPMEEERFESFQGVVYDQIGDTVYVETDYGDVWRVKENQCSVISTQTDESLKTTNWEEWQGDSDGSVGCD